MNNVRVFAENIDSKPGYGIYISLSGFEHFVAYHRRNGMLYNILKNGIDYNDLKRLEFKAQSRRFYRKERQQNRKKNIFLEKSVKHVIRIIDEYMEEIA